jgi:hypothetical protein
VQEAEIRSGRSTAGCNQAGVGVRLYALGCSSIDLLGDRRSLARCPRHCYHSLSSQPTNVRSGAIAARGCCNRHGPQHRRKLLFRPIFRSAVWDLVRRARQSSRFPGPCDLAEADERRCGVRGARVAAAALAADGVARAGRRRRHRARHVAGSGARGGRATSPVRARSRRSVTHPRR